MLNVGDRIFEYEILEVLDYGGMSTVYLAQNVKINRRRAIKELRIDKNADGFIAKQSLFSEKNLLTQLIHPNMPEIYDVIEYENSILIIMEYIQGTNLARLMKADWDYTWRDVVKWGVQMCSVLEYLHRQKTSIIYYDMKPANIMLVDNSDNVVKLIDFGAAREQVPYGTQINILGTRPYASPEQVQFGSMDYYPDITTDIYSLGATLYHLTTGVLPSEKPEENMPIRYYDDRLPDSLENVIIKCMQSKPEDRYQSAAELMYSLKRVEEDEDKKKKKYIKQLIAFFTACFLTIAFGSASVYGYNSAEHKKQEDYEYILANASDVDDYYNAILISPARTEAYRGLISFLTDDGILSSDENAAILKLRAGLDTTDSKGNAGLDEVLKKLETSNSDGFQDICFEIGEAYLFYSSVAVEKDRYSAAETWFQNAKEKYPAAIIYCDISECLQNIFRYSNGKQIKKLYEEYNSLWSKIMSLKQNAVNFDEDLRLRVWNEIVNMINRNAREFCEAEDKQTIVNLLNEIASDGGKITSGFLQDSIGSMIDNIEITITKINSVDTNRES